MKVILENDESILQMLDENIATPYMKIGKTIKGLVEYGYCVVNEANEVEEKYMAKCEYKDAIIDKSKVPGLHIYMNITNDGYIRFWIDNVNYYIKWEINEVNHNIKLVILRRKK